MSRTPRDLEVRALALKALQSGCKHVKLTELEWDVSSDCEKPYVREHRGEPSIPPSGDQRVRLDEYGAPLSVLVSTRCHQCAACLKARYWLWRLRAATELCTCQRSWFGTITLRPEAHHQMMCRAASELSKRCVRPFDECDEDAQFRARHGAINAELTLWLKRVRKQSGASLRYLLVCEAHKSGLPHYHILMHQASDQPVLKKHLAETWPHGFSQWKLVEDATRTSGYVTKYLLKDARARLRASVQYGRYSPERVDELSDLCRSPLNEAVRGYDPTSAKLNGDCSCHSHIQ